MKSNKNLEDLREELSLIHRQVDDVIQVSFNKKTPKKESTISQIKFLKQELDKAMTDFREKLRGNSNKPNLTIRR